MNLKFVLPLLISTLAFSQTPATTPAPIAHVYVGTTKGIYLYNAATTGKLALVSSKPSTTPAGLLIGITGTHLVSLGTFIVHSYQLSSTGVIGKHVSEINTQDDYDNGNCGSIVQGTVGLASL